MIKTIYSLAFTFGMKDWKLEGTPPELLDTVKELEPGKALDLGCGEGEHAIALAKLGWHVTGVDFVKKAILSAEEGASKLGLGDRALFLVGDVAKLDALNLPLFDFAFDIGCFHLLKQKDQIAYIRGLSTVVKKSGLYLLYAFTPRKSGGRQVGFYQEYLEQIFSPGFSLEKSSEKTYWRFPACWYWFRRN